MDEHLIGYLRNTLDPATRRSVEAYLRTHPDAEARVHHLRQTLGPWDEDSEAFAPPADLVRKTLARVAEHRCRPLPPAPRPATSQVGTLGPRRYHRADVAVAAGVLFLVGTLTFTWVAGSRARAQEVACQNQMRQVWEALEQYSAKQNHGEFPRVESDGPRSVAGAFVPILQDAGFLSPDVTLVCSSNGERAGPRPSLRELEAMYRDQPDLYTSVARTLAGTYAYTLGYGDNGALVGLRRDSGDFLPLLADAPPLSGVGLSLNHGGRGQNVLYIGGNVRWCTARTVGVNCDDIYLNQDGKLRTGRNWGDTVLAPSGATPFGQNE
jgi:hypothetical protein